MIQIGPLACDLSGANIKAQEIIVLSYRNIILPLVAGIGVGTRL